MDISLVQIIVACLIILGVGLVTLLLAFIRGGKEDF